MALIDGRETITGALSPLAPHVTRIDHIVVNVADLDATTDFYTRLGVFRIAARGRCQGNGSAGLELDGPYAFSWVAMDDFTGGNPVKIVLTQWETPALTGSPYPDVGSVGLVKFALGGPNAEEMLERVRSAGISPTNEHIVRGYISVLDPDGTLVSLIQEQSIAARQLFHVHLTTYDLNRSITFYRNVLGLDYWMSLTPDAPRPASQGPGGDLVQWNSHFLRHTGDHRFTLDIGNYVYPETHGEPHRLPTDVGISAIAFEVDDMDAASSALRETLAQWAGTEARVVGEVETWTGAGGTNRRILHFVDPDGNRMRLIERDKTFVTQFYPDAIENSEEDR